MSVGESKFHGLARLASEHGLDVSATVLRVATDLFCQHAAPSPRELLRYTELASALLQRVDAETRRLVAEKLAKAVHAPEKILRLLLDDEDVTVATAVIRNSAALKLENFTSFLEECGPAEAAAIARREDIDPPTIQLLATHPNDLVIEALLENMAVSLDAAVTRVLLKRIRGQRPLLRLLFDHPACSVAELAPVYPLAPPELRAKIRSEVELRQARSWPAVPIAAVLELNEAILAANRNRTGAALGKALRLDPTGIHRVLDDSTGEVLILALAAAGIKRSPAIRYLLTCAPDEVRLSTEKVFAAANVYETTSRRTAREIATAVAGERRSRGGAFEPHMHPSDTPQRTFGSRRRVQIHKRPSRRADIVGRR